MNFMDVVVLSSFADGDDEPPTRRERHPSPAQLGLVPSPPPPASAQPPRPATRLEAAAILTALLLPIIIATLLSIALFVKWHEIVKGFLP